MIVEGAIMSGLEIITEASLSTIGEVVYWHDHDKAVGFLDTNRANSWGDQSINGFTLTQGQAARLPRKYSDGIGIVAGDTGQPFLRSTLTDFSKLKCLSDGSAHLLIDVIYHSNTGQIANDIIKRTGGPSFTSAGFVYQILTNNSLSHTLYNDAGTSLGNHATGANSVPQDTRSIVMYTYYGRLAMSNNSRLTINNVNYSITRDPVFGTGNPKAMDTFFPQSSLGNTAKHELSIAYNLTGKTITQVNDFVTLALTTLKKDSRFSGLTTI